MNWFSTFILINLLKKKLIKVILKSGIHSITKKRNDKFLNWNKYIIGKNKYNSFVVNLDITIDSLFSIYTYIQRLIKKNGKILFVDRTFPFSKLLSNVANNNGQHYVGNEEWLGGSLTNFNNIRWFYYFKNINIGYRVPEAVVTFDNILSNEILFETKIKKIPLVGSLGFTRLDRFVEYFVVGELSNLNSIIFFIKLLELAIINGRNIKIKYRKPPEIILVYWKGRHYWIEKPKKKKKWRKKQGLFFRTYKKEIKRIAKFRPLVRRHKRRVNLIRKLIAYYYNWSRTKRTKKKLLKKMPTLKKRRVGNRLQQFLSGYERRIITVLYRLRLVHDRFVALYFLNKKWIWVNNRLVNNKNLLIRHNDIIWIKADNNLGWFKERFKEKRLEKRKKLHRIRRVSFTINKKYKKFWKKKLLKKLNQRNILNLYSRAQGYHNISIESLTNLLTPVKSSNIKTFGFKLYELFKGTTFENCQTKKLKKKSLLYIIIGLFFLDNLNEIFSSLLNNWDFTKKIKIIKLLLKKKIKTYLTNSSALQNERCFVTNIKKEIYPYNSRISRLINRKKLKKKIKLKSKINKFLNINKNQNLSVRSYGYRKKKINKSYLKKKIEDDLINKFYFFRRPLKYKGRQRFIVRKKFMQPPWATYLFEKKKRLRKIKRYKKRLKWFWVNRLSTRKRLQDFFKNSLWKKKSFNNNKIQKQELINSELSITSWEFDYLKQIPIYEPRLRSYLDDSFYKEIVTEAWENEKFLRLEKNIIVDLQTDVKKKFKSDPNIKKGNRLFKKINILGDKLAKNLDRDNYISNFYKSSELEKNWKDFGKSWKKAKKNNYGDETLVKKKIINIFGFQSYIPIKGSNLTKKIKFNLFKTKHNIKLIKMYNNWKNKKIVKLRKNKHKLKKKKSHALVWDLKKKKIEHKFVKLITQILANLSAPELKVKKENNFWLLKIQQIIIRKIKYIIGSILLPLHWSIEKNPKNFNTLKNIIKKINSIQINRKLDFRKIKLKKIKKNVELKKLFKVDKSLKYSTKKNTKNKLNFNLIKPNLFFKWINSGKLPKINISTKTNNLINPTKMEILNSSQHKKWKETKLEILKDWDYFESLRWYNHTLLEKKYWSYFTKYDLISLSQTSIWKKWNLHKELKCYWDIITKLTKKDWESTKPPEHFCEWLFKNWKKKDHQRKSKTQKTNNKSQVLNLNQSLRNNNKKLWRRKSRTWNTFYHHQRLLWPRKVWNRNRRKYSKKFNKLNFSWKTKKWRSRNYPRNYIRSFKYGVAIYFYTPQATKILIGRFLTVKRLKILTQFSK